MPQPLSERSLRSQVGAHTKWAACEDRAAATEPARRALLDRFDREVDPEGTLPAAERARRADHARSAYFAGLALKSRRSRRQSDEKLVEAGIAEAARLAEYVERVVADAPALTSEQRDRIAVALRSGAEVAA